MNRPHYLYFFQCLSGLPTTTVRRIARFDDLEFLWKRGKLANFIKLGLSTLKAQKLCKSRSAFNQDQAVENLKAHNIKLVLPSDYPELLKHIHSPPALLYAQGKLSVLQNPNKIAIVGTRNLTNYGQRVTNQLMNQLAHTNATVVSGGAWGIDTLALKGAVEHGLPAITVIGSGLARPTPHANYNLYQQIKQNGLILSEYPPFTNATKYTFPERNRIISGMSKATIVVEAPLKSGAIITARFANDEGREIYAVPGPIDSFASQGTNKLLFTGEARALHNFKDLLSELDLESASHQVMNQLKPLEQEIYKILQKMPMPTAKIAQQTKMNLAQILSLLSQLELKGVISKDSIQNYFVSV